MRIIAATILMCGALSSVDPNDMEHLKNFARGWLSPGEPIGQVFSFEGWVIPPATSVYHAWTQKMDDGTYFLIRAESPTYLKVTGEKFRPVNYKDFAGLAKSWKGDPNSLVGVTEPNGLETIEIRMAVDGWIGDCK